jgi:DNA-binding HxlR family transcriptional regulator
MLGRNYTAQNCSAARALEVVGERWSLLILRDALFRGMTRFTEFQRSLGIAPNVLTARLQSFVEDGLFEVDPAAGDQPRYQVTDKARDLAPVIIALTTWGDHWAAPNGPPVWFVHEDCGGEAEQGLVCRTCSQKLSGSDVLASPGPGATARATGLQAQAPPSGVTRSESVAPVT